MRRKRLLCLLLVLWSLSPCVFVIHTGSQPLTESPAQDKTDFVDVQSGPYEEAIYWARDRGITTGTDETHFNPYGTCIRAHIITFIWRYDAPEVRKGEQPFVDVPPGCYYDEAAHWAYDTDIEPGDYVATEHGWCFMGYLPCTRLAAVTYLWKLNGRPTKYMHKSDVFDDVVKSADEVRQAVGWAVHYEITKGTTETTFDPESTCTRAQIATFLYRTFLHRDNMSVDVD